MTAVLRMRLPGRAPRERRICQISPARPAVDHANSPGSADDSPQSGTGGGPSGPRYFLQPLPESSRVSIYDNDDLGEVCNCPGDRAEKVLAALNAQARQERLCTV